MLGLDEGLEDQAPRGVELAGEDDLLIEGSVTLMEVVLPAVMVPVSLSGPEGTGQRRSKLSDRS
jgi:hypothetical protein